MIRRACRGLRQTALHRLGLAFAGILFASCVLSCRTPRTEVLVVVELDPASPPLEPIASLVITMRSSADGPDASPRVSQLVTLGQAGSAASLPYSFGIHPDGGAVEHHAFITIDACSAQGCMGQPGGSRLPVVTVHADVGFVREQTRVLTLRLSERCAGVTCDDGRTCDPDRGVCVDDHVDPMTLPMYDPDAGVDAGMPRPVVVQLVAGGGTTCARSSNGVVLCWGGDSDFVDYATSGPAPKGSLPRRVAGIDGAIDVTVGYGHACALMPDRTARCWGRNDHGQLGNGTDDASATPVGVVGLDSIAEISAGFAFTCARRTDGTVWCWGSDAFGQLGDGIRGDDREQPVPVAGLVGVVEIAAGGFHSCGRLNDGTARCWGADIAGEIGDGLPPMPTNPPMPPTQVMGLTDATQLTAGGIHNCARRAGGTVACWGNGVAGQLGVGVGGRPVAGLVPGIDGALEVRAGGWQTCARMGDRTVRCWGRNDRGQLGDGTTTQRPMPMVVSNLVDSVSLAVGAEHACAQRSDLSVVCWGNDASGALGSGRALFHPTPAPAIIPYGVGADAISLGAVNGCAHSNGAAWCWGAMPATGVVAGLTVPMQDGPRLSTSTPTPVPDLSPPPVQITSGFRFACATMADGSVDCWGRNADGELGNGTLDDAASPTRIANLTGVSSVHAGGFHACALRSNGTVACWGFQGNNEVGQGRLGSPSLVPVDVAELNDVVQLGVHDNHSCARLRDGRVKCWGANGLAANGDGTIDPTDTVVDALGISDAVDLRATNNANQVRLANGELRVWGSNPQQQLQAISQANPVLSPEPTTLPATTRLLAAGSGHSCSLDDDGSVQCWGANGVGQLGDGLFTDRFTPGPVPGLSNVEALTVGDTHTCALGADGSVACWGWGFAGEIGDGTELDRGVPARLTGLTGVTQLDAQSANTCALTRDHQVYCWGDDTDGGLGDERGGNPLEPVAVVGVGDGGGPAATQVAAGESMSCARMSDGTVRCWGTNNFGQLGDGTQLPRSGAVTVSGVSTAQQVVAGAFHACALASDGTVDCWGADVSGQIGDGAAPRDHQAMPVAVASVRTAVQLTTAAIATCALLSDGTVDCWGDNQFGELGDGTMISRSTPQPVIGLSHVTQIAGGQFFFCAVVDDGSVVCWGNNRRHEIGDPALLGTRVMMPTTVTGLTGRAISVHAGRTHLCARFDDGTVRCWGGNDASQASPDGVANVFPPEEIPNLASVTDISGGQYFTCVLRPDGTVDCWGWNGEGELGNGTVRARTTPMAVHGIANAVQISSRFAHTCALLRDGTVRCWGFDLAGQLGSGVRYSSLSPVQVRGFARNGYGVEQVSSGTGFACARMGNRTVRCWGANFFGQLGEGSGSDHFTPTPDGVAGDLANVLDVSAGNGHACAVLSDHTVRCWGRNDRAQLGDGMTRDTSSPRLVPLSNAIAVAAGGTHTCALLADHTVRCWGANDLGQIGNGTRAFHQDTPVAPVGLPADIAGITAGGAHTCAWTSAGAIYCWGAGARGQLGDGATMDRSVPVAVTGLTDGVVRVDAGRNERCTMSFDRFVRCTPTGDDHTCAVRSDGTVWCWGANERGQLGDGTTVDRPVPTQVPGLAPAADVRAGGAFSCAAGRDGSTLSCWGDDTYGQLGNGTPSWSALPVTVNGL